MVVSSVAIPPEGLAAPAAFEANDKIAVNRSADRQGGGRSVSVSAAGFSVPGKRLMDGRDQSPDLI